MDLDRNLTKDEFLQHCLRAAYPNSNTEHCTICLESYSSNHQATQISICNHIFGDNCINIWFSSSSSPNTCPLCRSVLFEPELGFISDSEDSESETDVAEEEMFIWDNDSDSDFDSNDGDISEDSDDEYDDVGIAVSEDRPQRRSSRHTQHEQPVYNEEEIAFALVELESGITRYVNDMWITMWMLVEESRASVPTKPIKQEWLLATLATLEPPVWCVSYTLENILVTIARRMIRRHRDNGCYVHGRDHTADINSLLAEASSYI